MTDGPDPAPALAPADDAAIAAIGAGIRREVDSDAGELLELSAAIHASPEVRFAEHAASGLLRDSLARHGFEVTAGIAGLPTAFRAEQRIGTGDGPAIAVFCEYDALPGLGHGCGHNIIAAAGLGASLAAARWAARPGTEAAGTLIVLGSPGEEGGGGKVYLIEHGHLAGVDAAVMIHPAGYDAVSRMSLGRVSLEARFTGRASHAAAAPEFGRNALDAATVLLVAIGLLRQQLRADSRVHAIITRGGDSVNIIPSAATVRIFIRSPDSGYLRGRLFEAVRDCVHGAALATGTTAELDEVAPAYQPVQSNPVLADLAQRAFGAAGRPLDPESSLGNAGSTDMGNVSHVVPALHPYIQVTPGTPLHTADFVSAAGSADGGRAVLDGATVVGTMVAALLSRPALTAAARAAFDAAGTASPS